MMPDFFVRTYQTVKEIVAPTLSAVEISRSEQRAWELPLDVTEYLLSFVSLPEGFTVIPHVCKEFRELNISAGRNSASFKSMKVAQKEILRNKRLRKEKKHPYMDNYMAVAFTYNPAKNFTEVKDISVKEIKKDGQKVLCDMQDVSEHLKKFPKINFAIFCEYPENTISSENIKVVVLSNEPLNENDWFISQKLQKFFFKHLVKRTNLHSSVDRLGM